MIMTFNNKQTEPYLLLCISVSDGQLLFGADDVTTAGTVFLAKTVASKWVALFAGSLHARILLFDRLRGVSATV